jgi:hypothetical protein
MSALNIKVRPSGSARATSCAPMIPLPPERFRTTQLSPSIGLSCWAKMRPIVSIAPPGA